MKDRRRSDGMSLVEMLTVVAIIGLAAAITMPAFETYRRKEALKVAAREIAGQLRLARSLAISRSRNVGVRFAKSDSGAWLFAVYEDGDFDGVRTDDIRNGIDRLIRPSRAVLETSSQATLSMPAALIRDPDSGKILPNDQSPIRFGNASLCSFSPAGAGTAGSVFLSDETDHAAIVRVYGATGRVRIMLWFPATGRWSR